MNNGNAASNQIFFLEQLKFLADMLENDFSKNTQCNVSSEDQQKIKVWLNGNIQKITLALEKIFTMLSQADGIAVESDNAQQILTTTIKNHKIEIENLCDNLHKASYQADASIEYTKAAKELVEDTASTADFGQLKAANMLSTMKAIADSSDNIAQMIKFIDEVSFQTNLLALNAAVEAARAGEHGKGFAIVAQEVRSLANRSTKASKEMSGLIADAGQQIHDGVRLAKDAHLSLTSIIANITKLNSVMADINNFSHTQSTALTELNHQANQNQQHSQHLSQQADKITTTTQQLNSVVSEVRQDLNQLKAADENTLSTKNLPDGITAKMLKLVIANTQTSPGASTISIDQLNENNLPPMADDQ